MKASVPPYEFRKWVHRFAQVLMATPRVLNVTEAFKVEIEQAVYALDSTVIDLCATLFDWAQFRRTKGAVKLHCLLDHDGYLPSVVVLTEGRRHDVRVARTLRFDPGTIVVMARSTSPAERPQIIAAIFVILFVTIGGMVGMALAVVTTLTLTKNATRQRG